jgi:Ca2+-dependent lipid-binding protein
MQDGKRVEKKKTPIIEKTLDPVYNEEFLFAMPYDKIRQTQLLVSVVDWDRIGRNETIGSILLGTKSGLLEVKHWNEMFAKPRQAVAQWHMLKDLG